jgi:hypothetical protein
MARRVLALVAVVLLTAAALWYVQAPPRSPDSFRERTEETALTMRSQAQVTTFWVQAVSAGRVTQQAATVGIEDAERDAQATSARFAGWDPPPDLSNLATQLAGTGSDLVAVLREVRIATHRGDWAQLPATAAQLGPLADRLAGLARRAGEGGR